MKKTIDLTLVELVQRTNKANTYSKEISKRKQAKRNRTKEIAIKVALVPAIVGVMWLGGHITAKAFPFMAVSKTETSTKTEGYIKDVDGKGNMEIVTDDGNAWICGNDVVVTFDNKGTENVKDDEITEVQVTLERGADNE